MSGFFVVVFDVDFVVVVAFVAVAVFGVVFAGSDFFAVSVVSFVVVTCVAGLVSVTAGVGAGGAAAGGVSAGAGAGVGGGVGAGVGAAGCVAALGSGAVTCVPLSSLLPPFIELEMK